MVAALISYVRIGPGKNVNSAISVFRIPFPRLSGYGRKEFISGDGIGIVLTTVIEVMSDVLETDIRAGQNFFDLGDSVDAVEFCARLRDRTGLPVPIELLWEVPDVKTFATEVAKLK
jgi:acyl carrier protein